MSKLIGGALLALFVTAWPFVAVEAGSADDLRAVLSDAAFAGMAAAQELGS